MSPEEQIMMALMDREPLETQTPINRIEPGSEQDKIIDMIMMQLYGPDTSDKTMLGNAPPTMPAGYPGQSRDNSMDGTYDRRR